MPKCSLIDLLWKMKRGELLDREYGICHHLATYCASIEERLQAKHWMLDWPEHSGNELYPVPPATDIPEGSASMYEAETAYEDFVDDKWHGEYGATRKRLLNYLITRCEASNQA